MFDWIKGIWYSEKGRNLISIFLTVLIVLGITLPSTILLSRNRRNSFSFNSYLYNSSTATALRINSWMEIPLTSDSNGNESYDLTILQSNPKYAHFVRTDDQMLSSVKSSKGIGYLSQNQVIKLSGTEEFRFLDVFNEETQSYEKINTPEYSIPTAPLDMVFKVPGAVVNDFRNQLLSFSYLSNPTIVEHGSIWTTSFDATAAATSIENSGEEASAWYSWVRKENYEWDLFLSFLFFNYVSFSKEAIDNLFNKDYAGDLKFNNWIPEEYKINEIDMKEAFINLYNNLDALFVELGYSSNPIGGDLNNKEYSVVISGSGTPDSALTILLTTLNEFLDKNFPSIFLNKDFTYGIINYGSGAAWIVSDDLDSQIWVDGSGISGDDNEIPPNSFLGLQSRKANEYETNNWHLSYGDLAEEYNQDDSFEAWINEENYSDVEDFGLDGYYNPPLGSTIATESTSIIVPSNVKYKIDGQEYYLTGITKEGARLIYLQAIDPLTLYEMGGFVEMTPIDEV